MFGICYLRCRKRGTPSQSFAITLIVLPAIVTIIILLVGNNVARAFSLAGAFAIIRFRSVPGSSRDITYVLLCMAVGLACGMGYLVYGLLFALLLSAILALLNVTDFGARHAQGARQLRVTIPEDLDYEGAFDDILNRYTDKWEIIRVRTADLGSVFELRYSVTLKQGMSNKAMIDEIRAINGNMNVSLDLVARDIAQEEF